MTSGFLIDTNTLSARLNFSVLEKKLKAPPERVRMARDRVADLSSIKISILTFWEIERGLLLVGATKRLAAFHAFCANGVEVLSLHDELFGLASQVWVHGARAGHRPPEVDALIVATATFWDLTVVTNDDDIKRCADNWHGWPWEDWFEGQSSEASG